jgi:prevent-host-death family protein
MGKEVLQMSITASKLRENIYRILDRVLQTGIPVEIVRKGRKLKIVPVEPENKLKSLKKRHCLKGDPEDIVHLDWSDQWKR